MFMYNRLALKIYIKKTFKSGSCSGGPIVALDCMLAALVFQCRVADNKAYRAVQILHVNCKLKAEFL